MKSLMEKHLYIAENIECKTLSNKMDINSQYNLHKTNSNNISNIILNKFLIDKFH